ncbi:protein arginine N-methyltransferase HSL7 [Cordyceps fumosorosea ARSEF 2679]|uniref:Protein arginine N-methyltransferase n=1 Tax=Cordyceps fumosorosea (strain ARSEF 2679) TaxID=1081104 RepID=A0A167VX42_CORFA|nr:protein arginine N-methyltransferase HSL7 [Cordyceps fumosorosea ARSEF 2679]OAA63075.1 protein arginine N-methyltransferase HSL7 [Cordyceps fumosorosea ARSEF 2679]
MSTTEYDRPYFTFGYHDSTRDTPLNDLQYGYLLNQGFNFAVAPITNQSFRKRIFKLVEDHMNQLAKSKSESTTIVTAAQADPTIPPLTPEDTSLFPSQAVNTYTGCISPWIDLSSPNPIIASVSRQVLNLEINYASFCGLRIVMIPPPERDGSRGAGNSGLAQYARAVQEALNIGANMSFAVQMPMYREPGIDGGVETLSRLNPVSQVPPVAHEIDIFTTWDSWHNVRSACSYNLRLFLALKVPKVMPDKALQDRWFSEPLMYLTFTPEIFQTNNSGNPSLSKHHRDMVYTYMKLKAAPGLLMLNAGPRIDHIKDFSQTIISGDAFPSLSEAYTESQPASEEAGKVSPYIEYMRWVESGQPSPTIFESPMLTSFQDWLQSPLQPLSDNLESATYEVFEGDPVKYNQYEAATMEALIEWKKLKKPTSKEGVVVIAVAGSGRGPLVTRALKAAEYANVDVEVWAVEKNPNAYVYLLRQNQSIWGGRVKVVKTDMRHWKGPVISESAAGPVYGKVDILISELLGSFGDNELSPECLDGIQHVMAPQGISIPSSYTAHFTPIASPKLHADIFARSATDPNAFATPWVVHLFSLDYNASRVPDHPRIQEAWEFSHPIPESTLQGIEARRSGGVVGGGGGSMAGAAGANDHNSRFCHLTFVCRTRGVTHGLAGYFESTLYESQVEETRGEKVEISTHPERIDKKSKDMISWFPIFFPLNQPLYFPADTELEVSMWRQTDDTRVWYEWLVEAWTWVGENSRVKVGSSELCSSRKMACLM